jgi:hypothetical protein
MRIPNGSTIMVVPALSPWSNQATAGVSSNAINFSGYYGAMGIFSAGSAGGGTTGLTYKVVRSGTSNGTYNPFGFTTSAITAGCGTTIVRNFLINTSCVWHRVVANNGAGGSYVPIVFLLGLKGPYEPVLTQDTQVTVQPDVLVG